LLIPFYFINGRVDICQADSSGGQVSTGEGVFQFISNGLKFNRERAFGKAGQLVPVSDGSFHIGKSYVDKKMR
jgi:hypothetical protein